MDNDSKQKNNMRQDDKQKLLQGIKDIRDGYSEKVRIIQGDKHKLRNQSSRVIDERKIKEIKEKISEK